MTDGGPLDVPGALGEVEYDDLVEDSVELALDEGVRIQVLNLERLIRLKQAAGREKDLAVLPVLKRTLEETNR